MRWLVAGLWLALLASCNEESSGNGGGGGSGSGGGAVAKSGGGGGFSADLAKEFADSGGSGGAKAGSAGAKAGSADPKAGGADPKAGGADPKAGGADPKAGGADPKAGSADAKAGSADQKAAGGADPKVAGGADPKVAGGADPKAAGSADPKAGSAAKPVSAEDTKVGTGPGPVIQGSSTPAKKVTTPAELAAIRFGMLPNWERDVQDAGTISLAVKIPGKGTSAVFVFRYGYEDPNAPADREAYKKWLADKRLLNAKQDRQSSSAWYLEGTDGTGSPAFRFVVNWGGKKLICYGSLYRDAESSKLGDLRDQTIIQAKQICETISL
jgi:hypothetical protein